MMDHEEFRRRYWWRFTWWWHVGFVLVGVVVAPAAIVFAVGVRGYWLLRRRCGI